MNADELARALAARGPAAMLERWSALEEMEATIGPDALEVEFKAEGAEQDRKEAISAILIPHMRSGASSWQELHDALTPDEHERAEDLMDRRR